jgi:hypothetical protein
MTLVKDTWYTFEFSKSGEVLEDEFHQEYFNEEEFPAGEYEIEAVFSIETNEVMRSFAPIIIGKLEIVVK